MSLRDPSREVPFRSLSAWGMLGLQLLVPFAIAASIVWFVGYERGLEQAALESSRATGAPVEAHVALRIAAFVVAVTLVFFTWLLGWFGYYIVQPNVARVLVLFGRYRGTV